MSGLIGKHSGGGTSSKLKGEGGLSQIQGRKSGKEGNSGSGSKRGNGIAKKGEK